MSIKIKGINRVGIMQQTIHALCNWTTYLYAADHPENVSKLVHMDFPFPGFFPPEFGENGPWWWFTFQQVRGLPEIVLEGKEQEYYHGF